MNQNENENFNTGDLGGENSVAESTAPVAVKKKKPITVSLPTMIVAVLLAALITFQTTFVVLNIKHTLELTKTKASINKFQVLLEAYELFGNEYIYDMDLDLLIDAMLGAFESQDQYSAYYTYEEYLKMMYESNGDTEGIGVYYTATLTTITVTYVIPNSPAEKAGILAGDEIMTINGKKVADIGYYEAIDLLDGENGAQVAITVLRDGNEVDVTVTCGEYVPVTVICSIMEEQGEKIGYVKIVQFDSITVTQFKNTMASLRNEGCEKFIFDLRGNPGGELNAVISILDYLLPAGPIVHILDAEKNVTKVYNSDASSVEGEMVVLADGRTASAGELFTSALRDYDKATIIGTKTYGKGCGQSIHALSNGGVITVTSFFYNPPYGENYDGVGIYPDIEVELPDEYKNKSTFLIPRESDTQLQAAISKLTK